MTRSPPKRGEVAFRMHQNEETSHHHGLYEHDFTTRKPSTTSITASPVELRATTATFNTAELLEQILLSIPALHLLRAKATCRNFRNAIDASPALRKKMQSFIQLGEIDEGKLYSSDAGGDVIYPVRDLESLAFFYPSDVERRLFVRIATGPGRFEQVQKSKAFGELSVVDQVLGDVTVGWHCGCFADVRSECKISGEARMVDFSSVLDVIREKHEDEGLGLCTSMAKFWLDGLWDQSRESREWGC